MKQSALSAGGGGGGGVPLYLCTAARPLSYLPLTEHHIIAVQVTKYTNTVLVINRIFAISYNGLLLAWLARMKPIKFKSVKSQFARIYR